MWLLVLGAKSDIARAIAHRFAKEGFDIYLAARGSAECEADAKDISLRYKVRAKAVEFDVLDYQGHEAFYRSLPERPLGVVCTVGFLGNQKKAEGDFSEAKKIIETNYTGCVSILSIIANDFEQRKEGDDPLPRGFIIGISSAAGDRGRKSNYFYGSAKAGLTAYLSGLRNRLSGSGVHVMTVKPGFVATKMTKDMPLPKPLTASPEEVAVGVFGGWREKKDVVYAKWFWRYIMLIIRHIPERVFKKLNL